MTYRYPICIMYRYLPDDVSVSNMYLVPILAWYTSIRIMRVSKIKFYLKKKLSNTFQINQGYARDRQRKTDICGFYYFWDICNWLIVVFFIINITYIYIYILSYICLYFFFLERCYCWLVCEDNFCCALSFFCVCLV